MRPGLSAPLPITRPDARHVRSVSFDVAYHYSQIQILPSQAPEMNENLRLSKKRDRPGAFKSACVNPPFQ
jgi:hypothetical protein